ncbi:urease accessory protein UreF [Actinocorallia sp. API 0066]|uniref:urease accessory protein UreF n=1 Tax=Actinocorallia sp. API 0066 TaxID=2896846 RepID=UPI001E5AD843|nr:urease accessory UreF family protein [Actinocorallia sp. API 0066]MCD0451103.1 urease accessory protein UreF [Actinocorallia sp. API 0066]
MRAHLLMLADSRLPAGGHAHSGGLEPAVTAGAVATIADLADFLHGRLHTAGLVAGALAAAACVHAGTSIDWALPDAEADARTPSPAQRAASRAQGKSLLRAARATWPSAVFDGLRVQVPAGAPRGPHHPLVLGAAAHVIGCTALDAAAVAAYGAVTGPASAAVRLLGLDPLGVQRALAELAPDVDSVAEEAAAHAEKDWAELPAASAPLLDQWAEEHLRADLRLFES